VWMSHGGGGVVCDHVNWVCSRLVLLVSLLVLVSHTVPLNLNYSLFLPLLELSIATFECDEQLVLCYNLMQKILYVHNIVFSLVRPS
jgi:hypothetical protein